MIHIKHFRHYNDEREKRGVQELIDKHGATGYGVYWYLLERLYFSLDRKLEWTQLQIRLVSIDMKISTRKAKKIVGDIVSLGLVQMHDDVISSERVEREVNEIAEMRERRRRAASVAGKASAKARKQKYEVA
jgi:hypothetical protein